MPPISTAGTDPLPEGVAPAPRDRLERLEAELERLRPSLTERLEKLERTGEGASSRTRLGAFLGWMGPALPQFVTAVAVLVIGYWVKDSVEIALHQQELQLSYVKEMKEMLEAMAADGAPAKDVERAAVLVAAFGQSAVMPLMNELQYGGNRALGAEAGLRSLAFMNPKAVCTLVPRVARSPTRPLDWEGQAVAARVLAAGGCVGSLPLLRRQEALLARARSGDASALAKLVREPPSVQQQKEWLGTLSEAIAALGEEERR